jgi:hypothetical protein
MKLKRNNGKGLLLIALVAMALGVVNFILKRFVDGSLCSGAGIIVLIVWMVKRRG